LTLWDSSPLHANLQQRQRHLQRQLQKSRNQWQPSETLGLSMELNDDILVRSTPLRTIARVKRV
jgi:hypothetical protein